MARVRVSVDAAGSVAGAERLWYRVDRWPGWIDGFARLVAVEGDWPAAGAVVTWQSTRGGRGRVTERVVAHEPGWGQMVAVADDSVEGTQRVAFTALEDGVEVGLELDYRLRRGGPLRRVVDVLFIRRAQADALRRTLRRFASELAAEPPDALR